MSNELHPVFKDLLDRNEKIKNLESTIETLHMAHNDAHAEIALLKKYEKEYKSQRNTLRFYANPAMYVRRTSGLDGLTSDIDFDGGKRARRELGHDE